MLEQKITLRAKTVGFQPVIKTSQGDTGRKLLCSFEDFTIPDSSTAKIYVMKPSGKSVQNDATISDQTITVELTNQILAEKGIVACQIQVLNSGKAVKSFEFSLDNERSLAGDWPESENENTFLEGVVSEMQAKLTETINLSNVATSAAKTATQSANTATANANAAADEARKTIWNNKNLTNNTSAAESKVETAAGAAVLTGVDGKTEQVTTTGAQMLDESLFEETSGFKYIYINAESTNVTLSTNIGRIPTGSGAYVFIASGKISSTEGMTTDSNGVYLGKNKTVQPQDGHVTVFYRLNKTGIENVDFSDYWVMLNAGDSALPYEPYTGGIPGPNPDYPIPVKGVGGKTGGESFGFNAAIQSYQLFDASKIPTKTASGVTVTNNNDGSFTVSGNNISSDVSYNNFYLLPHETSTKIFKPGKVSLHIESKLSPYFYVKFGNSNGIITELSNDGSSYVLTEEQINDKGFYAQFGFYGRLGSAAIRGTIKPMVYQDGDGTWQPYHRSELPITLTQPLFEGDKLIQVKAGQTYVDADGATQTADRDLWGIERASFIVNGNEKRFMINKAWTDRNEKFIFGYITDYSSYTKQGNILCNALPYHYFGVTPENVTEECVQTLKETSGVPLYVAINRERVDSIDQTGIETYMKTANMIFVMNYTIPRFIPFADQSPFFGWTTPTGGCTITTDDPMEPIISADTAQTPEGSYLLTGYIDGLRGRTLEQRILELEKKAIQEV